MKNGESLELAKYIFSFLNDYAPRQKTSSPHTLKSYSTALSMYVSFLEGKRYNVDGFRQQ